ncbi:hypothetical protein E2542_SST19797 [Spatholobus suberectus]|nr:hypothetical protein E2542_SST19797 [Spatholobus suberectus]
MQQLKHKNQHPEHNLKQQLKLQKQSLNHNLKHNTTCNQSCITCYWIFGTDSAQEVQASGNIFIDVNQKQLKPHNHKVASEFSGDFYV